MDPLLVRQLRKHLPTVDPDGAQWQGFLQAVSNAYHDLREDRSFLEHTLTTTSQELTEANAKLRDESETKLASLSRYYLQTLELQQGMIQCVRRTPQGFVHTLCRGQLLHRFGLTPEAVEGRTIEEIALPAQAALINAAYARAWAGEEFSTTFTTAKGFELLVLLRPRMENGAVQELIVSCVEITALKQAERALIAAKERAETADRAKSEFLAVMSHEIRTPLNAVLGLSDLLLGTPLTPAQQGWLGTICSSGESLLELINNIFDFSQMEADRFTLHPELFSLSPLLNEVTTMFVPRARDKGLTFTLDADPGLPVALTLDRVRLRQVLVNLIGNAIKFTPKGSVHIRVSATAADPAGHGRLHFTITDTGIGVPPERVDCLFKPFSQVDSSATRQYGGAGLGLAISDRLVRILGGRIRYERVPLGGSIFGFSVQASFTSSAPASAAAAAPASSAAAALQILVAEDHPLNREFIRILLESRGYHPEIVDNGRSAVAAALRQPFDFILLDLQMPDMDGLQATRKILAQLGPAQRRPVIYALTAKIYPEDRKRCVAVGMHGLLAKPINTKELFEILRLIEADFVAPAGKSLT